MDARDFAFKTSNASRYDATFGAWLRAAMSLCDYRYIPALFLKRSSQEWGQPRTWLRRCFERALRPLLQNAIQIPRVGKLKASDCLPRGGYLRGGLRGELVSLRRVSRRSGAGFVLLHPRHREALALCIQSLQHQEHTLNRGVGGKWQPEWFAGDAAVVFTCGWRLPSNKIASHRRVTSSSSNSSSASVVGHVSSGRRLQTLTVLAKHHGNVCADNSSPTQAR